jgi:hypothetical protein
MTPTPGMLADARRFTIAFAIVTIIGLAVGVVIPMVLPGPKVLTIALGSSCFVLVVVLGARLLRRILIRGPERGL